MSTFGILVFLLCLFDISLALRELNSKIKECLCGILCGHLYLHVHDQKFLQCLAELQIRGGIEDN